MKPNLANGGKAVRPTQATYGWLGLTYDHIDYIGRVMVPSGASGIPNAVQLAGNAPRGIIGNASGALGLFGATGAARIATGTASVAGTTGPGSSGGLWYNGGSGTFFTTNDLVLALKNLGVLPA